MAEKELQNVKSRGQDDDSRSSHSTMSDMSALKSEIILPSKSKIPQMDHAITTTSGMRGGQRLYLTGLKKSTSLHSPLQINENCYPRIPKYSDEQGRQDVEGITGFMTPSDFDLSTKSEVISTRSKLNIIYKIPVITF